MGTDSAQFETIISKISSSLQEITDEKLPGLNRALDSFLNRWYIPNPVKEIIKDLVEAILDATASLIEEISKIVAGAAIPIMMRDRINGWSDIESKATGTSGEITTGNMKPSGWSGIASDNYSGAITSQAGAAAEIGTIAKSTNQWLGSCIAAAIIFYGGIAVALASWLGTLAAAEVAVDTVVGAPAGAAAAGASTAANGGMIAGLATAYISVVGAQVGAAIELQSQASDSTGLNRGHWPSATANAT